MIAVDTNILVYAHRKDSPFHGNAYESILELAEGRTPWAIPWPCIHEFLAITTYSKILNRCFPSSPATSGKRRRPALFH